VERQTALLLEPFLAGWGTTYVRAESVSSSVVLFRRPCSSRCVVNMAAKGPVAVRPAPRSEF
jgi:hypothetical protein